MSLTWRILTGDVRETLKSLPDGCVQTCVTSPPYWGLRDYGNVGQLGMQQTPDAYVSELADVFDDVRRVLSNDGTAWVVIGDSYQNAKGQAHGVDPKQPARRHGLRPQDVSIPGLKPKDLVGIPWMFAFEARRRGWCLRSDIVWSKPNPMPESVQDRPTKSHEYIFLISKQSRYYYDAAAIREPYAECTLREFEKPYEGEGLKDYEGAGVQNPSDVKARIVKTARMGQRRAAAAGRKASGNEANPDALMPFLGGANKRSVWHVATQPYPDAHFATYPEKLIEPCILAGSRPGDTVLDPFCGSGTTGAVAIRYQRNFIGCELNEDYVKLATRRIGSVAPLFASEDVIAPTQEPIYVLREQESSRDDSEPESQDESARADVGFQLALTGLRPALVARPPVSQTEESKSESPDRALATGTEGPSR